MTEPAPSPAQGTYDRAFAPLAERFAKQLETQEVGASLCVYHRGERVVDLWGGFSNVQTGARWQSDTRALVFSVTKGLAAMATLLLTDRGELELDAPVAAYWPSFAKAGKGAITVRTLLNHRAGLAVLDKRLELVDCLQPERYALVLDAMESQSPGWEPGAAQGYHAVSYGMFIRELFERVSRERLGAFLRREIFDPLGSDARLGTGPEEDHRVAELYPPSIADRAVEMAKLFARDPDAPEIAIAKNIASRRSIVRGAFDNPRTGAKTISAYADVRVRRSELAWASATASARGLARAYLPFSQGGSHAGRQYVKPSTLAPLYERQSFSPRDRVLHKPLGWSQGFLKEDLGVFGPTREAFGHAGMGGALGWCDPVHQLTFGYVMNKLDWRVRSPRSLALCAALYECVR
ncbi:MAG: beta-lactamase family protein [Myxococcales bacterium]|nr:beta-lactamase family protein [Myxococcales bacterium]